LINLLAVVDQ